MSQGATNWPFLMLTARPVLPAATSRSVWRQRNAGIWSTSAASAATSQWAGSWTSVRTGRPVSLAMLAEDAHAFFEAGAAKAFDAGAIGLVVAGFEDEWNGQVGGDTLNGFSNGARMSFGLDDAGAGDQEKLP